MQTIHDPRYAVLVAYLRRARKSKGLTQFQVASKLGWHRTALSNIETRERRLDLLEAYQLCQVYGLELFDLERVLAAAGGGDDAVQ